MVRFDEQAGVYEAYSDSEGTVWIGAWDTYAQAKDGLTAYRAAEKGDPLAA